LSDIVKEAQDGFKTAESYWSSVYNAALEDLRFQSDEEGAQWDEKSYASRKRKNRPALTIDQLGQFINQVSNDIRMNTPSINVLPHSGGADIETAEIFQGLIRDIEHNSNADDAYDYAVNQAIKCSIGFIRVDHRYKDDSGFDQELYIERVINPLAVWLDPNSIAPDGSDAMCGWILEPMDQDSFKDKYPKAQVVSFGQDKPSKDDEKVTVCEYFKIKETEITLAQLADGSVVEVEDGSPVDAVMTRKATRRTVYRYHLSGAEVLKETTFPGDYIPIIPVYGEEAWIDGERHLFSLIRKAKDPQRRYNFWASTEAELLMKSPKATIIAVGGTTENYAKDYQNPDDAVVLRYDQTDAKGNPAAPPQINPGPQVPTGIVNAMSRAADDIKATMGLYNSFLGQRSNETSGVAIQQRKMEGDRAIYHFGDNLVRSITHVGRILVAAIPEIYSGPRFVRVIGKEEESEMVGINGAMAEGQERPFNLEQGQYSVRVVTGASFATMRQEAAEFFQQILQSQPALMSVAGDLMFKFMDFPGAQAMAERIKRTIPPNLLEESVDPQVMAVQQENEQLKQAIQAIQMEAANIEQQLQDKTAEIQLKAQAEIAKSQDAQAKQQIELAKLQLEQQKLEVDYEIKKAEIVLKERELSLKEQGAEFRALGEIAQTVVPQSGGIY